MNKSFSLTLNFGKKDEDIWEYLSPLSQEEREGIIKEALHRYVGDLLLKKIDSQQLFNPPLQGSWGLEDLFVPPPENHIANLPNNPHSNNSDLSAHHLSTVACNDACNNPLSHLFQLIGDEDDLEVLEFFRGNNEPNPPKVSEMVNNLSIGLKEIEDIEVPESISEKTRVQNQSSLEVTYKGLDFVLNQVIGEEEDPEVKNFFRKRNNPE